jgi:hypothetical protein
MAEDLDQLAAHVRYRIGSRVEYAKAWRVDELTRLIVRHWPHHHLEQIELAGGQHHKALDHAMTLMRAQVREQWEARYGVGPLWNLVLAGTIDSIATVLLDLWWSDLRWRARLKHIGIRG